MVQLGFGKRFKHVIFDLDGTLFDPFLAIKKSLDFALSSRNLEIFSDSEIRKLIGPPLAIALKEKFPNTLVDILVKEYRAHHFETGLSEYRIYPGILNLLENIKKNCTLNIASSKPSYMIEKILTDFGIRSWYSVVEGLVDGVSASKVEYIRDIMTFHNANPDEICMIGDRKFDILSANKVGVYSIGVTWGYGDVSELSKSNPCLLVTSVDDLNSLFEISGEV